MRYGLLGEKLGHSYSKVIHEKLGDYKYDLIPLSLSELHEFMKKREFKGLNVTIPYKEEVMQFCDNISHLAKEIGAVNTLYIDANGQLHGTNTDYLGFLYAIDEAGILVDDKTVLILGDGATHRTIKTAVLDREAKKILVASRKVEGETPLENAPEGSLLLNYKELKNHPEVNIVINATPVGMFPNTEGSPVDLTLFPNCSGVFDVVYNPYYTNFIKQAIKLEIPYASGLAMLVAQATAAAGYFTGKGSDYETENERIIKELKSEFVR